MSNVFTQSISPRAPALTDSHTMSLALPICLKPDRIFVSHEQQNNPIMTPKLSQKATAHTHVSITTMPQNTEPSLTSTQ